MELVVGQSEDEEEEEEPEGDAKKNESDQSLLQQYSFALPC